MVDRKNSCWTNASWRDKPVEQPIAYPDAEELERVLAQIAALPPLVTSWEIEDLTKALGDAAVGNKFLLHAGDCAEDFSDCQASFIVRKLKILLQMSLILFYGCRKPVIKVGRLAGQYAKPRSSTTETQAGQTLPTYRGANINRPGFSAEERRADPKLLLKGHEYAAMTLNFTRALVAGGFADLHHPEYWNLEFFQQSPQTRDYLKTTEKLSDAIQFMESLTGTRINELTRVDFYTSHEALHLAYEQATTRQVPRRRGWYNLGTHFPWIGDRTRLPAGAHVEYCRGIANPIGVKVGPTMTATELVELIEILNPRDIAGRLTLIHRLGTEHIGTHLPPLIEAARATQKRVLWCCDPMHGNTRLSGSGVKTRRFDDIVSELGQAFAIHERMGSILGGVHLELTGEDVTECLGGAQELDEADLARAYTTHVDPRLNYQQALEIALLISRDMCRATGRQPGASHPGHDRLDHPDGETEIGGRCDSGAEPPECTATKRSL